MAKTKKLPKSCFTCGSTGAMYIDLGEGKKLPSYAIDMSEGVIRCHPCHKARSVA
jgi:hypothetical protein